MKSRPILMCFIALALSSQTVGSSQQFQPNDTIRPYVLTREPLPGSQNIWVRSPIRVVFSEPIKRTTVTNSSVFLKTIGGTNIGKLLFLSGDGKTLTIRIIQSQTWDTIPVPSTLVCILTNAITDLAGNKLLDIHPVGWIWQWTYPAWHQLGGIDALNVHDNPEISAGAAVIDIGTYGNPVVAWGESDFAGALAPNFIRIKTWDGTQWRLIDTGISGSHQIAAHTEADFSLAWSTGTPFVYGEVYGGRWNGQSFEKLNGVLNVGAKPFSVYSPSMALDHSGNPVIAWMESYDINSDNIPFDWRVYVKRWIPGTGWAQVGPEFATFFIPAGPIGLSLDHLCNKSESGHSLPLW